MSKPLMEKNQIFEVIKENIVEIVPELSDKKITLQDSLKQLGANSIDRAEILIKSMMSLNIKAPLTEFSQAKNIDELATIFMQKLNG
jgi:polyketide biosynthesis acyl carrier protein